MKYDYYLKRQKSSLQDIINKKKIADYEQLVIYFKSIKIQPPTYEEAKELFKEEVKNVEERSVDKSDSKKKGISNKKANNSSRSNSSSTRGSTSKQRVRKSPVKRQRKRKSDNDESVQPASGSEDTK